MIVFDLACGCGVHFEGWFQDRDDFTKQFAYGLVTCPACGGSDVRKIPSPVAFHAGAVAPADSGNRSAMVSGGPAAAAEVIRKIHSYVEKNFEDVGPKLAEEAIKMHYGDKEARNIRGVTTPAEEKLLNKEGIEILKLPILPKGEGPH